MFGYIRPYSDELKIRDFELFRSVYCSLCHSMKREYGQASRMILNFDFTFLAMLLSPMDSVPVCVRKSCIVSPIKKRSIFASAPHPFDICAAYSVILTYWKLRDSIADEHFFASIKARFALIGLRRAYKKAARTFPDFDVEVKKNLSELSQMELERIASIDKPADKFALILAHAANHVEGQNRRVIYDLLYHTGRWIYIIDAYNDISDDLESGNYNPIAAKYSIKTISEFTDDCKNEIELTLTHSLARITSAYELMDDNVWSDIVRNIIYLGMPNVFLSVKHGSFTNEKVSIKSIGEQR